MLAACGHLLGSFFNCYMARIHGTECVKLEINVDGVFRISNRLATWSNGISLCHAYQKTFESQFQAQDGKEPAKLLLDTCQTAPGFLIWNTKYEFAWNDPQIRDHTHASSCLRDRHLPFMSKACDWSKWLSDDATISLLCRFKISFLSLEAKPLRGAADVQKETDMLRERPRYGGAISQGLYKYLTPLCEDYEEICRRVASVFAGSGFHGTWSCASAPITSKWKKTCWDMGEHHGLPYFIPTTLPGGILDHAHAGLAQEGSLSQGSSLIALASIAARKRPRSSLQSTLDFFVSGELQSNVKQCKLQPFPSKGDALIEFRSALAPISKIAKQKFVLKSFSGNMDAMAKLDQTLEEYLPVAHNEESVEDFLSSQQNTPSVSKVQKDNNHESSSDADILSQFPKFL